MCLPTIYPESVENGKNRGNDKPTRLEEHRQSKIDNLERRILLLVSEEEILRFQIPMHNAVLVAHPDHFRHRLGDGGRRPLAVVAARDDPVEELPALAQLHDEVHRLGVLVGGAHLDDVGVLRQARHDRHLAADVLDVDGGAELLLRDRLAGERLARLAVRAEVGDAELTAAELAAEDVLVGDPRARHEVLEHADRGRGSGVGIGEVLAAVVFAGFGGLGFGIWGLRFGRSDARVAIPHGGELGGRRFQKEVDVAAPPVVVVVVAKKEKKKKKKIV